MSYNNYHKHDHFGNPWTMDTIAKPEDYCKRAVELRHNTVFTVNHGVTGNIFEWMEQSKKYGLKMCYGMEAYFVKDRFEKDRSNRHLIIIAKNNDGVMQLNDIMTEAHSTGFYYSPRVDLDLVLNLNPENFILTSACVAGIWNDPELLLTLHRKFGKNFFLEVQAHNIEIQKQANAELLRFSRESHIPIIHANDSHYIYPDESKYRGIFQRGKSIFYPEEDGMILDYPNEDVIFQRYKRQGVLSTSEVRQALENTLVFDECEPITLINDEIKLPSISNNPNEELRKIIRASWLKEREKIPKEEWKKYTDAISYELDIVEKTNMSNYFLIDYHVTKNGQEKYDGRLTNTGRGSAPSFYITKLLGLTDIDRVDAPITLFPTRFMSVERILGTRSLPDIDLNTTDRKPFIAATKDLLGEENCAWMLAWKPLQDASAFRVYCKGIGKDIEEYDEVAKNLEKYEDDSKWKNIINESKRFVGVIESISESPCFVEGTKILASSGYKSIENISVGDYVLTHNNRYRRVTNITKRITDKIVKLECMGSISITTTPNHPFYIRKRNGVEHYTEGGKLKTKRTFTNPEWIECKDLEVNDFVGQPVNSNSIIPTGDLDFSNPNFWWIIGKYIRDGWKEIIPSGYNYGTSYHTSIYCDKESKNENDIESYLDGLFNYTKIEESTTYRYDIFSEALYMYLHQFGEDTHSKKLTDDVLDLPVVLLKSFLDGYIGVDGYKPQNGNAISITTTSYDLALGIQKCIHKCYHIPATLTMFPKNKTLISIEPEYHTGFFENDYMWLPIRRIGLFNIRKFVYNFSVEEDESYTVENIAVHNCSMLLYDKSVRHELGLVRTSKDELCCLLDGYNCDKYKYLKNDYLTVTVWAIIRDVCKLANIPIPTIKEFDKLLDDKTFAIYEKGLTSTINQADSDFATGIAKTYCPKSVSEMSAFVAIIRPGCASLLQDFIERKPYTTGVTELDEILVEGSHRMIYQELIMKYLIWLGIPETGSYDIIKKIAKKKFKEEELKALKEQLSNGWIQRVGREEGFAETWTVVEQAARYSFNASHSLSYAYDSLYGAYLKSHYPLEYYTVALNYYKDDSARTLKLTNELSYFGIELKPIKFRYSKSTYSCSKEDNSIYKGIESIKNMNAQIADEVYNLRENNYSCFSELLYDLKEKTSIKKNQIKILIELDFFEEFGDTNKLLSINEFYERFAKRSEFRKAELDELGIPLDVIRQYSQRETDKMFMKIDVKKFIHDAELHLSPHKRTLSERIVAQIEYLGYITIKDNRYNRMAVVLEVNTKYSPKLKMYSLKNGTVIDCKISKQTFNKNKLKEKDIIRISSLENKAKSKKDENDNWVAIPGTKEVWITGYTKVNNF